MSTAVGSQSVRSTYRPLVAPRPSHWLSPTTMSNAVWLLPNSWNTWS